MSVLIDFRRELDQLIETRMGTAELDSMEDWLELRIRISDGRAHIEGTIRDPVNALNFGLQVEDLGPMAEQLAEIEREYPIRS